MINKELYGGREDGKLVHLPEHLPYVLEMERRERCQYHKVK